VVNVEIDGPRLPLVIQANIAGVDLPSWAVANRTRIEELLDRHGALLFRGFAGTGVDGFERTVQSLSGELLEYNERSSPRNQVAGKIYTSTEHPPDQTIFLHNENSYAHSYPQKIFFQCDIPAKSGGATPLADCRAVFDAIRPEVRDAFIARGILYVRNFDGRLGLSWKTVFGSGDRDEVETRCRAAGYDFEWIGEDRLRTRRVGPAAMPHPRTGEWVWFNHATFFHVTTLPTALGEAMLAQVAELDLPNQTYYGDGTPIEAEVMDELRAAYRGALMRESWQAGDVLFLDNMLVAHGRDPFEGERRVRVAMSEARSGFSI
jgi:alpha-ketoglutarate-dependent taurine dioxygenase